MRAVVAVAASLCLLLAGVVGLDRAFPPDLARAAAGIEVLDRSGRTLSVLPAAGGVWRLPTAPADVPPHLLAALIVTEDKRFRSHLGVDPLALARAAAQWVRAGRVVSGGSTLSMQVARLLEPRPRTLRSKAIEIARAVQLEARLPKDAILGLWLTLAPMGGNLEGVRAGALAWFGKPAAALEPHEGALLLALARRPERVRPDRHPDAAARARDALLARLGAERAADDVPRARKDMPRHAPHLARELARGAAPGSRIATTLDLPLQRALEGVAETALRDLPERAAVALAVADPRAREWRALVGGRFGDPLRAGALDLTRAVRSPGSAFKPALYALAFEAGLAAPETLIEDLPRRFGGYAPENFDRGFAGRLTVADALRQSLNLPAVALLEGVGPLRFAQALRAAGAAPRLPPGEPPGLPLALGGLGTTLREATGLYAALAEGGRAAPLRAVPGGESTIAQAFQSRAAAQAMAVLVQPFPVGGPPGIAWKTGTSWGGRDAWAFGADRRHVVGVWVGRPDGTPIPGLTGLRHALPLLARTFERLPAAPREPLSVRAAAGQPGGGDRLRLIFPPPGAVLGTAADSVVLRAGGGQRPLTFLVDGVPLPAEPARREAAWMPPGPGFYRVTVLDAAGGVARAEVRVR